MPYGRSLEHAGQCEEAYRRAVVYPAAALTATHRRELALQRATTGGTQRRSVGHRLVARLAPTARGASFRS